MPKSKKPAKRALTSIPKEPAFSDMPETYTPVKPPERKKSALPVIIVFAVIILAVLAVNRGFVFAAIINGRPIFRWQLTQTLISRFGQQTLESMMSEMLITQEAAKTNVTVTQAEIDKKEEEILASFGGKVTLDELLTYQGITKSDFDGQVRMQILLAKIVGRDISVTDTEVNDYITANKATMTATEGSAMQTEARQTLYDQKMSEKVQPWFTELKNKAKVLKFL